VNTEDTPKLCRGPDNAQVTAKRNGGLLQPNEGQINFRWHYQRQGRGGRIWAARETTGNRICKLLQTFSVDGLVLHRRLSFAGQEL